jgi:phthalate 4,5-cis-dihydrodiol dehydrogenase
LPTNPIRFGLIGVGRGASQLIPALTSGTHARLVAAADLRVEALRDLSRDPSVATYTSVADLLGDGDVEAVWVATPNHLHAQQAIAALQAGKHVVVSKPMAISLEETGAMIDAAQRNGVQLVAGHAQSMAPSIRLMASLVRSDELGRLGMLHTWHFTDWMHRPRQPDELDVSRGGGPVFRQASHQVDIVRSIAHSPVRSVRAQVVQLDPARGAPGAYTAYLEFESGVPATIVYSGYGYFGMDELLGRRRGGNSLGMFGLTLVTCERGDIRESPDGVLVYGRDGCRTIEVADEPRGAAELEELYEAVRNGRPITHDGEWGQTTLEVCLAIHESARTSAEIHLGKSGRR